MSYGLELRNAAGQLIFGIDSNTCIFTGSFDVTGKTAAYVGDPAGLRSLVIPAIPANTTPWCYSYPVFENGGVYSDYDETNYILGNTLYYRIDLASVNTVTRYLYGLKGT